MSGQVYWFICTNAAYPSVIPIVAGAQIEFNRRTANALAGLGKSRHEVGDLLPRPNVTPVANHLLCDGSAVNRTDFPQLFAEIGTDWGAGDGTTTFNVPNFLTAAIPNATTAPTQTVTGTTVSTGGTVTAPTGTTETGGTRGGNVSSGSAYRTVSL